MKNITVLSILGLVMILLFRWRVRLVNLLLSNRSFRRLGMSIMMNIPLLKSLLLSDLLKRRTDS